MQLRILFSIIYFFSICGVSFSQNEIEVTFYTIDSLELEGTLLVPNNGKEKHPLIVFIHGSGPNDRDETTYISGGNAQCLYPNLIDDTIKIFKDIAEFLSVNGYATFRYDKRTYSHSNSIDPTTATPYDFASDMEVAINLLKTRTDIDSNCISLLGHSQGGTLIPYIATKRNDIKNMIGLASPSTPIDTLIASQIRDLYYICANDTTTGNANFNQGTNIFSQVRDGTWSNTTPINGIYPTFWKAWIDLSDSVIYNINQANIPTYLSFGVNDFNVPLKDTLRFETELIAEHKIAIFDDLNHFLTTSSSPHVKEELLDSILLWLNTYKCETETNINSPKEIHGVIIKNTSTDLFIQFEKNRNVLVRISSLIGQEVFVDNFSNELVHIKKENLSGIYFLQIIDEQNNELYKNKIYF